jgi:hypothetical protein
MLLQVMSACAVAFANEVINPIGDSGSALYARDNYVSAGPFRPGACKSTRPLKAHSSE